MRTVAFNKSIISSAVSAALFMSVYSANVYAQDGEQVEKEAIETIEVTATRRAQNIQDVPFNISAVGQSQINAAGWVDTSDLLREMPGISVPDGGGRAAANNNAITIRGLNLSLSGTDAVFLTDPTVSTYVNDTPAFGNFILKDIERVEILRGPQGTLYGSGSLGGTVRYIMNRPEVSGFYGKVDGTFGQTDGSDGNNQSANIKLNIPLNDNFAVRLNAGKISNDGVIDYVNAYQVDGAGAPLANGGDFIFGGPVIQPIKDADTVDIDYQRVSVLFEPSEDFNALLTYMNQSGDFGARRAISTGINKLTGNDYADDELGAALLEPAFSDNEVVSLEVEYNLGFATLSSSSSLSDREYSQVADNTGFQITNGIAYWYGYGNMPRLAFAALRDNTSEAFTQELRLVSNANDSNIDWVAGLYYQQKDTTARQSTEVRGFTDWRIDAGLDPALAGVYLGNFYDLTNNPAESFLWTYANDFEDKAAFGEITYHFSDKLQASVGFRYFENVSKVVSQTGFPIFGIPGQLVNDTQNDSDILFKGNISYKVNDDMMLYGTISEGYRRGGSNAAPVRTEESEAGQAEQDPNDPQWASFDVDTVVNYEIGVKGTLKALRYTANLFYVDWSNPQLNTSTPSGFYFAVANGESAQTVGLETEFTWSLTADTSLTGGYTYVDAELTADFFTHDADYTTTGASRLQALDGDTLPGTAKNTLNLALTNNYDLTSGLYLASRISYFYQSSSQNSILTEFEGDRFAETLPSFSLLNASFTVVADTWTAGLAIKNITNEKGTTGTFTEEYMGGDGSFYNFSGTGQKDFITTPRTVTLYGSYFF
jgi:iron complex outermembrane receptor protein